MVTGCSQALLGTFKAPAHQEAVDLALAQVRADLAAGRRTLFKPPSPGPGRSGSILDERIGEELNAVARELGQLGAILADDPILLRRHSTQLQAIDRMQQVLGHLSRVVEAGDKAMAVDRITLSELQCRLKRKALRSIMDG